MDNRNIRKEESAVSPVIGVILMVAITVILAAVIGAFVFGMGTPEKTPAANIEITTAKDPATGNDVLKLEHRGGDDLPMNDVKILVKVNGAEVYKLDPAGTGGLAFSAGEEKDILTNPWTGTAVGTAATALTNGTIVEVELWYNPTGQRLAVISKATST